MEERKNTVKTIKTKYMITKFWWWNLKIKVKKILEWGDLSGKLCNPWVKRKNGKVFQNHLKSLTKSNLVHSCIVSKFVLYNYYNTFV